MQLFNISEKGELNQIDRLNFKENDVYLVDDKEKNTIYIWVGLEVSKSQKDITADIARKIDKDRGGSVKILIMKQKREYGSFLAMMHNLEKGLIPGKTIERRPEFIFKTPPEEIKSVGLDGIPKEREITTEERIIKWLEQIKAHRKIEALKKSQEATSTAKFIKFEQPFIKLEAKGELELNKTPEPIAESEPIPELVPEIIEEEPEEFDLKYQIREAAYYLSLKGYTYNELCWILAEKIQKISLNMPSIEDIKQKAEQVFNSSCTYDELCWLNAEMDILTEKSYLKKEKRRFGH
ncbi:MAG: hypothetical protein R3255_05275 [Candidatus Lokiarchaeia archaeon]|nr:hypothetical protein [Candidatus Lokiarchaeia archaeon]